MRVVTTEELSYVTEARAALEGRSNQLLGDVLRRLASELAHDTQNKGEVERHYKFREFSKEFPKLKKLLHRLVRLARNTSVLEPTLSHVGQEV